MVEFGVLWFLYPLMMDINSGHILSCMSCVLNTNIEIIIFSFLNIDICYIYKCDVMFCSVIMLLDRLPHHRQVINMWMRSPVILNALFSFLESRILNILNTKSDEERHVDCRAVELWFNYITKCVPHKSFFTILEQKSYILKRGVFLFLFFSVFLLFLLFCMLMFFDFVCVSCVLSLVVL